MIKSMTAFAETTFSTNEFRATVEIRGYNSRYLDIAVRIPPDFGMLEDRIRRVISECVTRGRVETKINILPAAEDTDSFEINEQLAVAYYEALIQLRDRVDPDMQIPFSLIVEKTGVIEPAETKINADAAWRTVRECLLQALNDFNAMKVNEGNAISDDLKQRLVFIEDCISRIEKDTKNLLSRYQERLRERIGELTRGMVDLDPGRITQEAAFLADKSDISEEVVRAKSHLDQFRRLMASDNPSGRSLNFLLQEFNREFNTMGSKAGDADLSHLIVSAKTEIEKMREQVQNVE